MDPLTDAEKAWFDTIMTKAADLQHPQKGSLYLTRMMLDGKPVAVIGADVYSRFSSKREGMMPLALLLTSDSPLMDRLVTRDGGDPAVFSPYDLDPNI